MVIYQVYNALCPRTLIILVKSVNAFSEGYLVLFILRASKMSHKNSHFQIQLLNLELDAAWLY
jgi:hypothetical protein